MAILFSSQPLCYTVINKETEHSRYLLSFVLFVVWLFLCMYCALFPLSDSSSRKVEYYVDSYHFSRYRFCTSLDYFRPCQTVQVIHKGCYYDRFNNPCRYSAHAHLGHLRHRKSVQIIPEHKSRTRRSRRTQRSVQQKKSCSFEQLFFISIEITVQSESDSAAGGTGHVRGLRFPQLRCGPASVPEPLLPYW